MESGYYPPGADTKDAPWNEENNPEKEIEVLVSVTLSKTLRIKTSDYRITDRGTDEEGEYYENIDWSDCNLVEHVLEQHLLPQEAYSRVEDSKDREDLRGWTLDDMEAVIES